MTKFDLYIDQNNPNNTVLRKRQLQIYAVS